MFKARLRELRNERNLTQEQLAKIINLTRSSIAGYENGSKVPTIETISILSKYFNVTSDYLLGLSDKRNSQPYMQSPSYNIKNIEKKFNKLNNNVKDFSSELIMLLLEKMYEFQESNNENPYNLMETSENTIDDESNKDIQRELELYRQELLSKKETQKRTTNFKKPHKDA